jgi:hypothetical protein
MTTRAPNVFELQVARPGTTFQVKADLPGDVQLPEQIGMHSG